MHNEALSFLSVNISVLHFTFISFLLSNLITLLHCQDLSKRDHCRQKLMGDHIRVFGSLVTVPDYDLVSFRTGLDCMFIVYVQGE